MTGLGSFKPIQGHGALACYVKATEASVYFLERECLVREGSKVHVLPYASLRVEVLPPDSRRTFDLQLECTPKLPSGASAADAPKPFKIELSMLPANECASVAAGVGRSGQGEESVEGALERTRR